MIVLCFKDILCNLYEKIVAHDPYRMIFVDLEQKKAVEFTKEQQRNIPRRFFCK